MIRISDIMDKEVINVKNGKRMGYITDIDMDINEGKIISFSIVGDGGINLFSRGSENQVVFWNDILKTNESLSLSLVAIAAILGHNYTIFLKFKGGKGVATSAAAFMIVLPIPFLITAVIFFGLKLVTKIVSIRSLAAGVTLFLSTLLLGYNKYYVYATLFTCLLVFWRHKSNIARLIKGEEK